jgi:Tc toxin complex TcA C-terminal TcB-binding domain
MPDPAATPPPSAHGFHAARDLATISRAQIPPPQAPDTSGPSADPFPTYTLQNFYHPLVGRLIKQLNQGPVAGMLDPGFLKSIAADFFTTDYQNTAAVKKPYPKKDMDLSIGGPYANYNWELLYHLPVAVAVHLSQNQRFAEAEKWFHLVFDPTSTDTSVPEPQRYWKFLYFRTEQDPGSAANITDIGSLLELLSTPGLTGVLQQQQQNVLDGYLAITQNPFLPHLVARTRPVAYQYYVVMRYLDNLIAWGDSLFANPTIETVNEATLCYVLAANLLGPRPQQLPARGTTAAMTYAQLRQNAELGKLDAMGNALVELEAQFPFNLTAASGAGGGSQTIQTGPLFGIGRSLYFCVPRNPTLLGYWDLVANRLYKIRHCQNLQGAVQPLPLFDPPRDPGMLVKAAAAGIDVGSIVSGLNQPVGPVRCLTRIQKAIELCGEVRSFGNALLAAFEKGDAELLAQLRQNHELSLQQMTQNVRFLQWKQAEAATQALLQTRSVALERYTFYLRALGLTPDSAVTVSFDPPGADKKELTEENFDSFLATLVSTYDPPIKPQRYPTLQLSQVSDPSTQAGATGSGQLYLNTNESAELNIHMPLGRDERLASSVGDTIAASLVPIPDAKGHVHYWGIGASIKIPGGQKISTIAGIGAGVLKTLAGWQQDQGTMASKTGGYQRRTDDWVLQANLAACELMQIGRQIIASLLTEQVTYHEYTTTKTQVTQAGNVLDFLTGEAVAWPDGSNVTKLTTADLYGWMQGELTRLYYQYYRLALDAARKAEQTMKWELMRPEVDAVSYIQPNYWDSGRQGLLSGEALNLDLKRMEADYLDNNRRELELTANISLRQLDPLALLSLRVTGSCTVTIPEAYYDRFCPGHYLRRIKTVGISVPAVVGPFTDVNCTLTLQSSTVRVSSQLANGVYGRDPANPDARFADYYGSVETVVTSGTTSDSGMFETSLRDDRFLPFEGQGAVSTWNLSLPGPLRPFDYTTISDVILHVRYTARDGGGELAAQATKELQATLAAASQSGLGLLFSLRYDFPTEWSAFVNGSGDYSVTLRKNYFPFMVQGMSLVIDSLTVYAARGTKLAPPSSPLTAAELSSLAAGLNSTAASSDLTLPADSVLTRDPQADVWLILSYHIG